MSGEQPPRGGESLDAIFSDKTEDLLGQVFAGKFKIVKLLGKGGFGAVYQAHQQDMDRMVALKVMKRQLIEDSNAVKRFLREVRISSKFQHPNTVRIHEFGHTPTGQLFFTMEFLEGIPLSAAIKAYAPIDEWRTRRIAIQILKSLAEAHAFGMVHRDLKPDNVMLCNIHGEMDYVKVLDFGIVKIMDDGDVALTQTGQAFGTPKYMSPEQAKGDAVDSRVDIYAMGVILYEMLTGHLPFDAQSSMKLILMHAMEPPPPFPADLDLTAEMKALVMRLLSKEPDERPASVQDTITLIAQLPPVEPKTPPTGMTFPTSLDPTYTPTPISGFDTRATTVQAIPPKGSKTLPIRLLVSGSVLLLLIGAALVWTFVKPGTKRPGPRRMPPGLTGTGPGKRGPARPIFRGVTTRSIAFGMSAAFSGPSKELGRGMKLGILAAFEGANGVGGVGGKRLELIALDDGYEPGRTIQRMFELFSERKVFAIIGNVGTPTSKIAAPFAVKNKLLFFGAFTGAGLLRQTPPQRYVFNFRASYAEETAAMVRYFVNGRGVKPHEIAVFAQQDSFGDAGYNGVVNALAGLGYTKAPLRVGYRRNTKEVDQAAKTILDSRKAIKAIVMVGTYKPCSKFIRALRDKAFNPIFANVSFVGSRALAENLRELGPKYAEGVIVTQVVPHFNADLPGVKLYRKLMKEHHSEEPLSFVSLEGFLAARLMISALAIAGNNLTTEILVDRLERMRQIDLGIGVPLGFSRSDHQASHTVWGTILDREGKYGVLDLNKRTAPPKQP